MMSTAAQFFVIVNNVIQRNGPVHYNTDFRVTKHIVNKDLTLMADLTSRGG